jgi:hypothetical protein
MVSMTNIREIKKFGAISLLVILHKMSTAATVAAVIPISIHFITKEIVSPIKSSPPGAFVLTNSSKSPRRLSHQQPPVILHENCPFLQGQRDGVDQEKDYDEDYFYDTAADEDTTRSTTSSKFSNNNKSQDHGDDNTPADDTIRVRIWRALAKHGELSLKELGSLVGERNLGDLQSHLTHVSKQAKTFGKKSNEWKMRRNVLFESSSNENNDDVVASTKKLRKRVKILKRRGPKGHIFITME